MEMPKRYKTRSVNQQHLETIEEAIERICNENLKEGWVLITVTTVPNLVWMDATIDNKICCVFAKY